MVMGDIAMNTDLLVIGSGPGGMAAALHAAENGLDVILVDKEEKPGGICLTSGCMAVRNMLQVTRKLVDGRHSKRLGVSFDNLHIDLPVFKAWLYQINTTTITNYFNKLKSKDILYLRGNASFIDSQAIRLTNSEVSRIEFKRAIIATGSRPLPLPGLPFADHGRIMDISQALQLTEIPGRLLVVGGGPSGVEIASIYANLGSQVTLIEEKHSLLPHIDPDLTNNLKLQLVNELSAIHLATRLEQIIATEEEVRALVSNNNQKDEIVCDKALLTLGRAPNIEGLKLHAANIMVDEHGNIKVDDQQRTTNPVIFAVGDVTGHPMLTHKTIRQGRIAADVISGGKSAFDVRAIPSVVYTHPQIAWCGLTEQQAQQANIPHEIDRRRHVTSMEPEMIIKLVIARADGRVLGAGIFGENAEAMIGEMSLAIELGAVAEDLSLMLHPYPSAFDIF